MSKKYNAIAIGLGLLIGLPQGFSTIPQLQTSGLPLETLQLIGGFGLIGGLFFGLNFLVRKASEDYSIPGYVFFLVSGLAIGIPQTLRSYHGNLAQDLTMPGLFFMSISLGLIGGWVLSYSFKKII
jgi:hypothetical protein